MCCSQQVGSRGSCKDIGGQGTWVGLVDFTTITNVLIISCMQLASLSSYTGHDTLTVAIKHS